MKRLGETLSAILFALMIAVSTAVLWALAAGWSRDFVVQFFPQPYVYEVLRLHPNGSFVIDTMAVDENNIPKRTHRSIDGRPIAPSDAEHNLVCSNLLAPSDSRTPFPRLPWSQRIDGYSTGIVNPGPDPEFWYFIHDGLLDGHGYFERYDVTSKRLLDYFGKSGTTQQPPALDQRFVVRGDRFQERSSNPRGVHSYERFAGTEPLRRPVAPLWLFSSREILEVDLPSRRVSTFWQGNGIVDLDALARIDPQRKDPGRDVDGRIVVRTEDRLLALNKEGREEYFVELPAALRGEPLNVWELPEGGFLILTRLSFNHQKTHLAAWLTTKGEPKIIEIPLSNSDPVFPSWPVVGLAAPSPAELLAVWGSTSGAHRAQAKEASWSDALRDEWPRFWPTLLVVAALSVALAVWVHRHHRQYGLEHANLWAAFVCVLGLPGAFAYLMHRTWAVREACPACGALAPRDRDACFRCGKQFPGPAALATEIRA